MNNKVKILLRDKNCMPFKAHTNDAGWDLKSLVQLTIKPNQQALVDTGINIKLPNQEQWIWQAQIRPRSGLALKKGITITNTPGTIDSQYTGNVCVIIKNTGKQDFIINKYDKIAQLIITKIPRIQFIQVDNLQQTDRNSKGFGSSGI